MKRSLSIAFLFVVVFILPLISRAARCSICEKECETFPTDRVEFELRKKYLNEIEGYITSKHSKLINDNELLNIGALFELFNIPARKVLYKDAKTYDLLKQAESQMQAEKMRQSVGNTLPYDKVRPDIREGNLSSLTVSECEFDGDLPEIERNRICASCGLYKLNLAYDNENISPYALKVPMNIQLALKLHKIVESSDLVILLSYQHAADDLLLSYIKLFNNEKFVLGLDAYDGSPDWSNPELYKKVFQAVHKTICNQCEGFSQDLSRLVTEFGFPVLTFDKYHPNRTFFDINNAHYASVRDNLVNFLEARCPHAFCFGASTAITHLGDHHTEYDKLVEEHYGLIRAAYEQYYGDSEEEVKIPTVEELKTTERYNMQNCMAWRFIQTKVVRNSLTDKICNYYQAFNKNAKNKIPFIILLDQKYGLWWDDSDFILKSYTVTQRELLIQNLIKNKLTDMGFESSKVTTVYVDHGVQSIFSKEKNDLLADFSLDYYMECNKKPY
ncbi:hypothetical protein P0136_02995 [Lentisphaerota bacterium ZTH]|nr:hypothetical protein JYG24_05865 [Lentisphaerota bacterium]WET06969.1 hypothetical protein P0136_02995 [Lentisphaerota bacterium ZTH]